MKPKRKRIPLKNKNMAKATLDIRSVDVDVNPTNDVQTVTLVLTYSGQANMAEQIIQGEQLVIEIPSHAPPPKE
jgi:hypothetical protein